MMTDAGQDVPGTTAVSLLTSGRAGLTALRLEDGGWTLPDVALALYFQAGEDEVGRPQNLVTELVTEDGQPAYFSPGPDDGGKPFRIEDKVTVPRYRRPGMRRGFPGRGSAVRHWHRGRIWLPAVRTGYLWRCSAGDATGEYLFFVAAPPPHVPIAGRPGLVN